LDGTLVVAGYAAIVATGSLGWQVYRERRRLRTDIRLSFEHSIERVPPLIEWADAPPKPDKFQYELTLVAINRGETNEYVERMEVRNPQLSDGVELDLAGDRRLQPRGRVAGRVRLEHTTFRFGEGFVGVVELAAGDTLTSPVERLDAKLLHEVKARQG